MSGQEFGFRREVVPGMRCVMGYEAVCCTNRGTRKEINQDSACVMIADTPQEQVGMALLCDGMGGISMGECASRAVVESFVEWFSHRLPCRLRENASMEAMGAEWQSMLSELDARLREYGSVRRIKLGTTVTAMLFWKQRYLLAQSGDSRAYRLDRGITQLSEDQSFVQEQINAGLMTEQEARRHPRRNVLTDCIGGSRPSLPVCSYGKLRPGSRYLLCSDGFVHELQKEEIHRALGQEWTMPEQIRKNVDALIQTAMARGETDNITAVVVEIPKSAGLAARFRSRTAGPDFIVRQKTIVTEGSALILEEQLTTDAEE